MTPPKAKKQPTPLTAHGRERIDDYYWLNQREDPEVIAYLEAENAWFSNRTEHTTDLREELFTEIKGRIKQDDQSVPYTLRGYEYQTKYDTGDQYPTYLRRKLDTNQTETLLDVNELAEPHDFYNVGGMAVSDDNRFLVYGEDTLSRRIYTLKIKDLETGHYLPDVIPNTTGGAVWSAGGDYLFYSVKDESLRPYKIMRHKLGTAPQDDAVIFEETDETFRAFVYRSKSRKYIIVGSAQTVSNEYRLLRADKPLADPLLFQARERDLEYGIAHHGDRFFILTNYGAKNFQLMTCPESATGKENWTNVVTYDENRLYEGIDAFSDYIVSTFRKHGLTQLHVLPLNHDAGPGHGYDVDRDGYFITFKDEAYMAYTGKNPEFDTPVLRYGYQSMTTPATTYDFDMRTGERTLRKQQPVLGTFDPDDYVGERRFSESRDGTKVPLSIVYHKDTPKDGTAPLLLYAYGSYGHSLDAYFSVARLSLLNRGFIFVIAHIRGGEELGRQWYEDGKLLKKKNTFTDFVDAGEWLISRQYAHPGKLFAMGGSAGGLLMGVIINMRPDLWAGVVAQVPFVDVVTTMLDDSIPLTTGEYDEWGNPNVPEYYDYILSYSPYDQVTAQDYPNLLITTGLHDSQVQYWEPAKWIAKLRELRTNDKELVMYTNMEAGHGGASGRFDAIKEVARDYAWILDQALGAGRSAPGSPSSEEPTDVV